MVRVLIVLLMIVVAGGCERRGRPAPANGAAAAPAPTNRIDIPAPVRQNLGITFARVERRAVARTLRIAGRFELEPTARREYRAAAAGRVELLVGQFAEVEAGTPVYLLDSAQWRSLQRELAEAEAAVALAQAGRDSIGPFMEAHEKHHEQIAAAVSLWEARLAALEQLQASGGGRGQEIAAAQAQLATARADFAETLEKEAELEARRREVGAQLVAAESRRLILLQEAALLTGETAERLAEEEQGRARWRAVERLEVRAAAPAVVELLHAVSGGLVADGGAVVTTVRPGAVRFRAHALQSDLGRLAGVTEGVVVAPAGGSLAEALPVPGALRLAPTADPERRTIEVVLTPKSAPDWARAGVAAFLEVVVGGSSAEELAIPLASVARDGTQRIIFRRDPADPNKAIRLEADLGSDDGRWVVIKSGVAEGNEVVFDGVYQLMAATSGSVQRGGHFHPDGTYHEGAD